MGFPHDQHTVSNPLDPPGGSSADPSSAREGETMDPRSFALLYDHMFTGGLPPGEEVTWNLLWAARQFHLQRLAIFCEVQLALQVNVWNAAFFLVQSHKFASPFLWEAVLKFVANALPFVSKTTGWLLLQDHPCLLTEVMDQRIKNRIRPAEPMDQCMWDRTRPAEPVDQCMWDKTRPMEPTGQRMWDRTRPTNPVDQCMWDRTRPTEPVDQCMRNRIRPMNPVDQRTWDRTRPTNPVDQRMRNRTRFPEAVDHRMSPNNNNSSWPPPSQYNSKEM